MPHLWLLGKGLKDMSKKFCFLSITVKPVSRICQGKTSKWKQKRSSAWMSRRFGRPLKRCLKSLWISALKTAFWHSYAFLSRIHLPLIFPIFPGNRPQVPRLPGCSGESRDQICHQGGRKGQAGAAWGKGKQTAGSAGSLSSFVPFFILASKCQEAAEEKKRLVKVWRSSCRSKKCLPQAAIICLSYPIYKSM